MEIKTKLRASVICHANRKISDNDMEKLSTIIEDLMNEGEIFKIEAVLNPYIKVIYGKSMDKTGEVNY